MISQRKKQPPKPEEVQEYERRLSSAALLMDDEPNLRLLLRDYLSAEQNRMGTEALDILETATSSEQFASAQALAIGRKQIRAFQTRMIKMASDARKESEKPQEKKP